jgi:hypothetical protein
MSLRAGLYSPVDYFFIDATGSPGRAASRPFGDDPSRIVSRLPAAARLSPSSAKDRSPRKPKPESQISGSEKTPRAAPVSALDPAHRGAADAGSTRHLFLRRLRV